jgi:hypothetical protein
MSPSLPGSCACGAVRFEISEPLVTAFYCHCTRCQKRTGTAAAPAAVAAPGSVNVTAGEDRLRDWAPPGGFAKSYCVDCGSHLFARDPESGEIRAVRMSAFDADPGVRPEYRQFVAYAAAWEPIPDDGLPRFDERRPRA